MALTVHVTLGRLLLLLLQVAIVKISCNTECDGVIVVEPANQTLIAEAFGTVVTLNCSVTDVILLWNVRIKDMEPALTHPAFLRPHDIMLVGKPRHFSQLKINGTLENSGSVYTCVAAIGQLTCSSDRITVLFYGPPLAPANLAAIDNGAGSLLLSWSSAAIEGIAVNFTLTATNLNNSNSGPIIESGISDQNQTLTIEDTTPCDVYSFNVIARNAAGSNFSDNITSRFPSLPDISAVETSLQHSLARTAEGVVLNITFNAATSCPDYPVMNYTLVLVDGRESRIGLEEMRGVVSMVVEGTLVENSQYSFRIVVTNKVGEAQSTTVIIVTSDVQAVAFTGQDGTYSIQCIYLSGSNASGCVYILVSMREGLGNITGSIEGNSSGGASIEVANIGCYSEVLAHANTTGALPVRTSINTDEECPTTTPPPTTSPLAPPPADNTVVIVAVVILVVVVVLVVAALSVVLIKKKGYCTNGYCTKRWKFKPNRGVFKIKIKKVQVQGESVEVDTLYSVPSNSKKVAIKKAPPPLQQDVYAEIGQLGIGGGAQVGAPPSLEVGPGDNDLYSTPFVNNKPLLVSSQEPVYNMLEDPNAKEKNKKEPDVLLFLERTLSHSNPPPVPPFCPAGGDSPEKSLEPSLESFQPTPGQDLDFCQDMGYAEVKSHRVKP